MSLQESAERIKEVFNDFFERFEKVLEELQKAFDEANRKIEEHKRLLRRPPKWYVKANNPAMIVSRRSVYHCRNNC